MIGSDIGAKSLPLKKPKLLQHLFYEQRQSLLALDVEAGEAAGISDSFMLKSDHLLVLIGDIQAKAFSLHSFADAGAVLKGLQSWLRAMHFIGDSIPQLRGAARVAFVVERTRQAEICVAHNLVKDSRFAALLSDYFRDYGVRCKALLELGVMLEAEQGLSVMRAQFSGMSAALQFALLEELLGDRRFSLAIPNVIFELASAWAGRVSSQDGNDDFLTSVLRLLAKITDSFPHDPRSLGIALNVVAGTLKPLFETQQAFTAFIELIMPYVLLDRARACDFVGPVISRMRGIAKRFEQERLDVAFGNVCAFMEMLQKTIPEVAGVAHFTDELLRLRLFADTVLLRHQPKVTRLLLERARAKGLPFADESFQDWARKLNTAEKVSLVETLVRQLEGSTGWDWHTVFEPAFWEGRFECDKLVSLACAVCSWYLPRRDGADVKLSTESGGRARNWADLSKLARCMHDYVYSSAAQSARSFLSSRQPLETEAARLAAQLAQLALFMLSHHSSFQIIDLMRDFGSSALQKAIAIEHRYFLCQLYDLLLHGFRCEEKLLERLSRVLDPRNQPLFWLQTLIGDAQEYGQSMFLSRAMGLEAANRLACIKALQIPLKAASETLNQCKQHFALCSPEMRRRHCGFLVHLALHYGSPDLARAILSIEKAEFETLSCFKLVRLFCTTGHVPPRQIFQSLCQSHNALAFLNCLRSGEHLLCVDELMQLVDGVLNESLADSGEDVTNALTHGLAMVSILARLEHVPSGRRMLSVLAVWKGLEEAGARTDMRYSGLLVCLLLLGIFYRNLRPMKEALITEAQASLLGTILSRLASECGCACSFRLLLGPVPDFDVFDAQYNGRDVVDAGSLRAALDFKMTMALDCPERRDVILMMMLGFLRLFRGQLLNWKDVEVTELEIKRHFRCKG